ncbi:MAG: carbohydrate ABC transporter permease [Spirochaetaceae bacterium]
MVFGKKTLKIKKIKVSGWDLLNYSFLILFCISTLYPLLHLLAVSVSTENVALSQLKLIPSEMTFDNIKDVLSDEGIQFGFIWTVFRTVLGTTLSLIVTIACAYPLSKKEFPHKGFWTALIVFTMFFKGGLIPMYMVVRGLGLTNTIWSLVLPRMIDTFALLIMRNYFMAIPDSLEESARIDGADPITILLRIIIPISTPIIATVTLWVAVWHWNSWFDSMIYIQDMDKQVLQVMLRRIVLEGTSKMTDLANMADDEVVNPETIKAATVIVATTPILLVYPFLQKYFVKGVMVGSLKG